MGLEWFDRCTSRRWPKELEPAVDLIGVGIVLCNLNVTGYLRTNQSFQIFSPVFANSGSHGWVCKILPRV